MNEQWSTPDWRVDWISLEGMTPPVLGQYADEDRWNGWLCPCIDPLSVVQTMEALAVEHADADQPAPTIEWDGETLVLTEYDGEQGFPERLEPDTDGLYALGANAWVWSLCDLPEPQRGDGLTA